MTEKLQKIKSRFDEINKKLLDPLVTSDILVYTTLMKEHKSLFPICEKYKGLIKAQSELNESKMLSSDPDPEVREMAESIYSETKETIEKLTSELKILLLPKDENDDRNVIIEIRGGAGGEEAALFANSLYRMYTMYAAANNFKTEIINANPTELGGYKEISFGISGEGAYSKLKYESGVHRVQRVPETESGGRIHTSTITVAVLPEAEEVDVTVNPADLTIQTFRSSGAGGQHINKTESAIRIIHNPSGVVVECQEERSQHKNKDKAMKMLYSKLYEAKLSAEQEKIAGQRKSQVGTGDRSERIRTYNFPQGRVTDHRIGLTIYKLEAFLNGDCNEVFDALRIAAQTELMSGEAE